MVDEMPGALKGKLVGRLTGRVAARAGGIASLCRGPLLTAVVAALVSCGDVVRNDRSAVILEIVSLQAAPGNHPTQLAGSLVSSVITNITSPPPCTTSNPCPTIFNDVGQVNLAIVPKNIGQPGGPLTPTTNNEVTIDRFHIDYVRSDGRNIPGVDVPWSWDGAVTGTVRVGTNLILGFELVRHVAKEESPLVQLTASPTVITTIARVTFYGHDQVGNQVSQTGFIQVDFGAFPNN